MSTQMPFRENERVVLRSRKHWMIFARNALTITLSLLPIAVLYVITPNAFTLSNTTIAYMTLAGSVWLLGVWLMLAFAWTMYYLDVWVVTDRCLVHLYQEGLFSHKESAWLIENIQEITVDKSNFFQSAFDYGTLRIRGKEEYSVEGIARPEDFRAAVFQQIAGIEELTSVNAEQEKLLRTISHEVKGHLTKNAAALSSIVEGDYGNVPQPLRQMAGTALQETRKGVDMVMDVLSSSDFKTGQVHFDAKPFDLEAAVLDLVEELKLEAKQKGLSLDCFVGEGVFMVRGDGEKMRRQVLRNLIDNAIRYTPHGFVKVALVHVDADIVFSVTDSGIGISPEDMPRLFTPGGKGHDSSAINPASTGYGLSVAKNVVDAHGGTIWAESNGKGAGSQFFVMLPTTEHAPIEGTTSNAQRN